MLRGRGLVGRAVIHLRPSWAICGRMLCSAGDAADGAKKKTLMLTVAYLGTNYHGIQYDPHAITSGRLSIENVIEQAAHQAGYVADHNTGDAQKLGLWRSCRTDKGVHARANVVRMKLQVPAVFDEHGHSDAVAVGINAHLPADVRILAANRVSKTMCPRNLTAFREYAYYLDDASLREARVDMRALQTTLADYCGSHFFANFTRVRMKNYLSAAEMETLHQEQELRRQRAAAAGAATEAAAAAMAATTNPSVEAPSDEDDAGDEGVGLAPARARGAEERDGEGGDYKLLPTTGHPYPRTVYGDQHYVRHVFHSSVEPRPVNVDGHTLWRVRVVGSSFMYHQIRRMVAGALMVGVGALPRDVLRAAFVPLRPLRMHVPLAPAHPLLLHGPSLVPPVVASHLPSAGRGHLRRADWGPVLPWPASAHRRLAEFEEQVMMPHVACTVCDTHREEMRAFLQELRQGSPQWMTASQGAFLDSLQHHDDSMVEAMERQQRILAAEQEQRGSLDHVSARELLGAQFLPKLAVRLGLLPGLQLQRAKEGVVRSIKSGVIPYTWPQDAILDWAHGVGAEALAAIDTDS